MLLGLLPTIMYTQVKYLFRNNQLLKKAKSNNMKKIISILTIIVVSLFFTISSLHADTGTPGDPPGEPSGGTPIGGGAPIGGGSIILIGLAAVYGGRKLYQMNKVELEE